MSKKVVILGGGVLGTQIGLMCAYYGYDTYFWLRSESSIGRTTRKIEGSRRQSDGRLSLSPRNDHRLVEGNC